MNNLTDFVPPMTKFSIDNYILLNSGFNFAFDLAFSYRNVSPPVCYLQ